MKVTKKPNIKKYKDRVAKNNLPLFANEIITDIIERTQNKKDVNLRRFNKYTKPYAKQKGTSRTNVNLTDTGKMLNSIKWKKIKNGIEIYFSGSEQNAKAHGNQIKNKRKFFGIDRRQREKLIKKIGEIIIK